jgi:UDP-3-O-[3-hydroxymyristoyl] glucosamine N-acyltransferase
MPSFTAEQIAARVGGQLVDAKGTGGIAITGVDALEAATPEQITFIRDPARAGRWASSRAGAVLVGPGVEIEAVGRPVIRVQEADVAVAIVLGMFAPPPVRPTPGTHPAAVVEPSTVLGKGVAIGPGCYIGHRVRIGDRTVLHANVTVLDESVIGADCEFFPGVVIRERCELGDRVNLHPNVVIGADGFGYRPSTDPGRPGMMKIPQIGTVRIGNDVEIGAGSCVDRAKFAATVIGDGTKIDNLCQIAHNCVIGRCCVIAGQAGLAGSVTLGDGVIIGGRSGVRDHVTIGAGAKVAGAAAVADDVKPGATVAGYPARDAREVMREYAAMRRLPELVKLLRKSQ